MSIDKLPLGDVAKIIMGMSPKGDTYNNSGVGMQLLNGPTEFGHFYPKCTLFTTDSKRECIIGDLIFCVRGSTGRMNWADQPYSLGRGVCAIRGETPLDTRYIRYVLEYTLEELLNYSSGGTFTNLTKDTILSFKIPYPSYRHKIAAILSAYDDLIENNTRRIQILEEMAQAIYREWFVHFRFPGHEGVRMVDSGMELGEVPQRWEVKPFSEVAEFRNGYAFKPSDWSDEGIPIIKIAELKKGITDNTPRYNGDNVPERFYINSGDILFSWSADLNVYIWKYGEGIVNQHLFLVIPNSLVQKYYLFYSLSEKMPRFRSLSLGTTMRHIKRAALDHVTFLLPPMFLMNNFESIVHPIVNMQINLINQIDNLRSQRNILLSKLISGEIDVSDMEVAGLAPENEDEVEMVSESPPAPPL
jgi:type I restriction enzyme, S subunit